MEESVNNEIERIESGSESLDKKHKANWDKATISLDKIGINLAPSKEFLQ